MRQKTPMLGVCFGHQIMADALGGDVRKSEKGWGLGRHTYGVAHAARLSCGPPGMLAVACSHQDQVIVPPKEAEVILASEFTPMPGWPIATAPRSAFQPHPEFADDYAIALAELRRGKAPDSRGEPLSSIATPPTVATLPVTSAVLLEALTWLVGAEGFRRSILWPTSWRRLAANPGQPSRRWPIASPDAVPGLIRQRSSRKRDRWSARVDDRISPNTRPFSRGDGCTLDVARESRRQ